MPGNQTSYKLEDRYSQTSRYGIRTKKCNTCSPGGVIRAWHTPQRHKSAGEYGCVREQHIGELCRSGSPKHYVYLGSREVTICT